MNKRLNFVIGSTLLLLLFVTVGLTQAQGPKPEAGPLSGDSAAAIAPGAIPVQGRLTDASGNPLNGDYSLTFRLYAVETGGTALCADNNSVSVQNGLFNSYIDYCYDGDIWGQKLWFGVQVGSDPEMTPRQVIFPVPYALSLRPGATISGTMDGEILKLRNDHADGIGLEASGGKYGVYGSSSANGYGGYFFNLLDGRGLYGGSWAGTGVEAASFAGTALSAISNGTAIAAGGTGIITSTAKSYHWISGNDLRPWHASDTTIIDADTVGGASISPGATVGPKNVMLPIQITGPLYGQNVTISDLDVYWVGSSGFDGITAVLMRRQTGVCDTTDCYQVILHDTTDQVCAVGENPTGCTLHFDLTNNNVLTSNSGILYLTLGVNFGGGTGWVRVGGVRLTLEHD